MGSKKLVNRVFFAALAWILFIIMVAAYEGRDRLVQWTVFVRSQGLAYTLTAVTATVIVSALFMLAVWVVHKMAVCGLD